MESHSNKIVCIILLLIAMVLVITGCEKKDLSKGTIENINYEETDNITNYVKIETTKDKIMLIQLYPDIAPITVENFQNLVKEKYYDNMIFHRVIKDFMIQTGDKTGTGKGGSSKTIKGEFANNGIKNDLKHAKGIVSMARRGNDMDSASSQFFICVSDNVSYLDGDYAAFGSVIAGYEVAEEISNVTTDANDSPTTVQKIRSIRFVNITK